MPSSRSIEAIQADLKQAYESIDSLQNELESAYAQRSIANPHQGFSSLSPSLTKEDIERFSRQIMLEGIEATGMEKIRNGTVLCVGAGGLGSTIALYLCAAGVGKIILVDFDHVDTSNLHRQIIHKTACVNWDKVRSAKLSCLSINPAAVIETINAPLNPENAEEIMRRCDVAVDGSDNVAARYIINDAATKCGKPLVSGSAMRWEGQLSVYGYRDGPCYRCLFPVPPPQEAVGSCNDTGVMGPVPGMIGCMQALEALKILAECGEVLSGRMFLFDGLRFTARTVKIRNRCESCVACGKSRSNTSSLVSLISERPEYIPTSCASGSALSAKLLTGVQRCSPCVFWSAMTEGSQSDAASVKSPSCLCVDVRVKCQFDMAHLSFAKSLPLSTIRRWQRRGTLSSEFKHFLQNAVSNNNADSNCPENKVANLRSANQEDSSGMVLPTKVFLICRRGIASAEAVKILSENLDQLNSHLTLLNVEGGLNAFHSTVDPNFPFY